MIDIDELIEALRKSILWSEYGGSKLDAEAFLEELYRLKRNKEESK